MKAGPTENKARQAPEPAMLRYACPREVCGRWVCIEAPGTGTRAFCSCGREMVPSAPARATVEALRAERRAA